MCVSLSVSEKRVTHEKNKFNLRPNLVAAILVLLSQLLSSVRMTRGRGGGE